MNWKKELPKQSGWYWYRNLSKERSGQEPKCVLIEVLKSSIPKGDPLVMVRDGRSPQDLDYWMKIGGEIAGPIAIPGTPAEKLYSSVAEMVTELCSEEFRQQFFARENEKEIASRLAMARARKRIEKMLGIVDRLRDEFDEMRQMLGGKEEGVVSVPQLLLRAANHLAEQGKTVYDNQELLTAAIALSPKDSEKLKIGVYTAVSTLVKRGSLRRAPGGYCL